MNVQDVKIADVVVVENSRVTVKNLEGLMEDIKQHGLKQPIGVAKSKTNDLILIWGHRRLLAAKKLGWKTIPANVGNEIEMADLLIANVGENLHRENTTPEEDGRIFDRLRKMNLNNSEIAAKLSVPVSRVTKCLDLYLQVPDKYRKRVAYVGAGGNNRKGNIPASVMMKLISIKRMHQLSDASSETLLKESAMEELKMDEIALVGKFLDQKMTVKQALEKRKQYRAVRVDVTVNLEEMNKLLDKAKIDSTVVYLQHVIYGLLPPLKKPDFIELSQIPEKG